MLRKRNFGLKKNKTKISLKTITFINKIKITFVSIYCGSGTRE